MLSKTLQNLVKNAGSLKIFKKIHTKVLSIFTVALASVFGLNAQAGDINVSEGKTVVAGNSSGADGGSIAIQVGDNLTIGNGNATINTAATLIDINELESSNANSLITVTGTGGLLADLITATKDLIVKVQAGSFLQTIETSTEASGENLVIDLADTGQFRVTAALTNVGAITADADGDGVVVVNAALTQSDTIGSASLDIGTITLGASGATTFSGIVHAKIVNIAAATSGFSADVFAEAINLTGATTALTMADKLTTSGTGSVVTMNATAQKIILSGADIIAGDLIAATDGHGTVQVTAAKSITGKIGTSTDVRVGTVDIDHNFTSTGEINADAITIKAAKVFNANGITKSIRGTVNGDTDGASGIGNITVNSGGDNTKILTFEGAVGTTGQIDLITLTTEATFLSDVDSDGINVATATTGKFAGNLTIGAEDVTLAGTSVFDLNGSTTQTIVGGAAGEEIDGTGVVLVSNTSAGGVVFGTHATMDSANIDFQIAANARMTTSIIAHTVIDVTTNAGSVLKIDDNIAFGAAVFTATEALDTNSIHADSLIKMPANFRDADTLMLFAAVKDNDVAAIALDVNSALVDTGLVNYVASVSADDIIVTATENSDAQAGQFLGVTSNEARSLRQVRDALITGDGASGLDLAGNILSLENSFTATDRKNFTQQTAVQTEMVSGSTIAAKGVSGSVQGIISNRMASLRSGDAFASGMSAGGSMSAKSGFIQAFGSTAEQKSTTVGTGTQAGFDADSTGVAIGFDGISDAGTTVGLSLSMSNTDIDSKGLGKAKNDMDTYTASIYMDKATDIGYIEGSLTYGMSENSTTRKITSAGLNRTLTGAYDSSQISLNIGAGMPSELGSGFVTPYAGVTGTLINTDAYTEKSSVANDSLRLKITQDDVSSVVGTVGVKYHSVTDYGTPMISFALNNEFGDTEIKSNNAYQGGGSAFKTSSKVEEQSVTLGLGYTMGNDRTSIEFAYEADADDNKYLSHGGSIKLVGKF